MGGDLSADMKGNAMTNREFFVAIMQNEALSEDVRTHAEAELEKLDKRNKARSSKPSKTQLENEPIKVQILEFLANGGATSPEIGAALEISTQKAGSLCRQLVEDGKLTVEDVKVPKKGTQKKYSLIEDAE